MTGSPSQDPAGATAIKQQEQQQHHPEHAPLAEGSSPSFGDVAGADKGKGVAGGDQDPQDTLAVADDGGDSDDDNDSNEEDEADDNDDDDDDDDEDDDEEEDEEPRLKFARLTTNLAPVYRNGDATSSFLVAGDKMIIGTHSGNVVCALDLDPMLPLRHADLHCSMSSSCLPSSLYASTTPTPPPSQASQHRRSHPLLPAHPHPAPAHRPGQQQPQRAHLGLRLSCRNPPMPPHRADLANRCLCPTHHPITYTSRRPPWTATYASSL